MEMATVTSALVTAASSVTAVSTGDRILTYVTIGINAFILISNALLDVYRKWRDRDADKKVDDSKKSDASTHSDEHENKSDKTDR